jgi:mono/diheme cytochrome c family protein
MLRHPIIWFALLVLVAGATWLLHRDAGGKNIEVLPDMTYSARYNPMAPNPNFPDGKTLREPPAGTIAVDQTVLHYSATPEEALRAGEELASRFADTLVGTRERGAAVYLTFCVVCHGIGGLGDGAVARRGFPPPPSLQTDRVRKMKDGQFYHILTYGQGNMPSYASQISPDDRWRAIAHLHTLRAPAVAK